MLSVKLDDDACNDGLSTLDSRAKRATIGQGEGKGDRIAEKAVRQHPRFCSIAIGFGIIKVEVIHTIHASILV
ncbi:Alanine--tRNA ligase [Gossypium arboreum]|uniref:Alanine--tRNA ligase n=1 Tax=Gossypium arboreum TaxID=29729 RepID=A0A0B0NJP7_GOSAR|nr:Alanine--tRNA ligase [Gossypium arboreum]